MRWLVVFGAFTGAALGMPAGQWLRLRSGNFEIVTDAGERSARDLAAHLEQMRKVVQVELDLPGDPATGVVRVIAFDGKPEYLPYAPGDGADAFSISTGTRGYIVMALGGAEDRATAAHEYAHIAMKQAGLSLPRWLDEGMAEVCAGTSFQRDGALIGRWRTSRRQLLLRERWAPIDAVLQFDHGPLNMLYAESWGLAHMLMFSPKYAPRFGELLRRPEHPETVYGTSLGQIERDLQAWIEGRNEPVRFVAFAAPAGAPYSLQNLSPALAELAIAEMELTAGHTARAKEKYERLEKELPANADLQAALGKIAVAEGNSSEARRRFGRALELGVDDAGLCYDYAFAAREAGLAEPEIAAALRRALQLDPGMDDARYALALQDFQAERYSAALDGFRQMKAVRPSRAHAYYTARAYAELQLGLNDEAGKSSAEARRLAANADQRREADLLAWIARSELAVRLAPDGSAQLTRVARDPKTIENWNPFVEAGDRMERREARMQEVECAAGKMRITVLAGGRPIVLAIPDPSRIQVRRSGGGDQEFVCGKQNGEAVVVEYAVKPGGDSDGVLRGIRFQE